VSATETCPSCGSATPEGARYCPECGRRLDAAGPPAESRLDRLGHDVSLRLAGLRTRAQLLARSVGARESARARVASLRARQARLRLERDAALHELGAAVYAGDAPETESARARVTALDAAIATLEDEMNAVLADAEAQVAQIDAELRPTVAVTRPGTPEEPDPALEPIREPWPPPNEADPPEPAVIPEPSPQPVEEPYPDPSP
jgi:rRNA maturation protein Nop10